MNVLLVKIVRGHGIRNGVSGEGLMKEYYFEWFSLSSCDTTTRETPLTSIKSR